MAELADAHDSKSCGKPCGFESHLRHQMCDTCVSQRIMNSEIKHGSAKLQSHVSLKQKADTFVFPHINSFVINITPFTINNEYLLYIMSIFFCKTLQLYLNIYYFYANNKNNKGSN